MQQAYLEIGLCSATVLKRWNWDPNGDFNTNMNLVYAILYMVIIIFGYPVTMLIIYCKNNPKLDKK